MPGGTDETTLLCEEIVRISGGGDSVTYGQLIFDEVVEQMFEAVFGTLKSARKRGLVAFQGELLLQGKHDNVVISLTSAGLEAAGVSKAADVEPSEMISVVEVVQSEEEHFDLYGEDAEDEPETPMLAPAPPPASAAVYESQAPREDRDSVKQATTKWSVDTSYIDSRTKDPNRLETRRKSDGSDGVVVPNNAPTTAAKKMESGKWAVDTSYIDWRTKDPNRLEQRRSSTNTDGVDVPTVGSNHAPAVKKVASGKWEVDTSYIDHRTKDVNRLEARANQPRKGSEGDPAALAAGSVKGEDGKWRAVDTSYINHRTKDVENLDGRKGASGAGGLEGLSATVKKESDGKWKVDTGYIGYRTKDTDNLDRKQEKTDGRIYASPSQCKYTLAELTAIAEERPVEVDPSNRHAYLTDEDFQRVFGMSLDEFNKLPKWKQTALKRATKLF
eukprot:TRINITY_DN2916_c0_g2_i1.p1 TRINITY_DN2916_c0_g2~~TRINITY_DN2916_c0_g2_i1.p1  ORF type:complete len:444 (-),score=66.08 TRINITY_DN2916_c0_g2_i1:202-1533(-)